MLTITQHAQQRMHERGVTLPQLVECLKLGTKRRSKYRSARDTWCSSHNDRTAVYAIDGKTVTILTTY